MATAKRTRRWLQAGAAAVLVSSMAVQGAGAENAAAANGDTAEFNGQPGQWGHVPSASAELKQSLLLIKANRQDGKLKLLVRGPGLDRPGDWYIDFDGNEKTGSAAPYWSNGGGADLKVSGDVLWKAESGEWKKAGSVNTKKAGDTMETEVDLASLGIDESAAMRVAFRLEGDQYLPAPGKPMLVVPPPAGVVGADVHIAVDGNPAEWADVPATATGKGGVKLLKAFADNKKLYILAKAGSFAEETNVFIDSDNDADTGYSGWEFKRTGADYLLENGKLYRFKGPGWDWEEIGPAEWHVSEQPGSDGLYTLEAEADLSAYANAGMVMRAAIGVGEDYAPDADSEGEYPMASSRAAAPIVIDGKADDWNAVGIEAKGNSNSIKLSVAQDSSKIYLLAEGKSMDTRNEFYLDTDSDAATGYRETDWKSFGADAKIAYNKLYLYEKKTGKWKEAGPVRAEVDGSHALYYFYRSSLGQKKAGALTVGYLAQNAFHLPAAGGKGLTLKTSIAAVKSTGSTFVPKEKFGVLDNPFMGWVGWATETKPLVQPHKLVYANISWRDLEPVKGKIDWAGIEKKYQFAKWRAENTRINLRFVLDDPGEDSQMDIPQWLYDELVAAEGESGAGKWYDTPDSVIGKGFAPNYASSLLITEHERILNELGKRYDNDPAIAFVQIGSLGHWGEFHNWPEDVSGVFPSLAVSDKYVNQYLKAFPHKLIGMRKPFPIAADNKLGLFNDVFGSKGSTDEFLGWAKDGWSGIGPYVEAGQSPEAAQAASRMPDFWKTNYSGGEFHSGNPLLSLSDDTIIDTLRQTRASHTSWMGPSSPAAFVLSKDIDSSQQANIDLMHNTMGYRFVLDGVSHAAKAKAGQSISIGMSWSNKGVAPFYQKWPLALAVIDSKGKLVEPSIQRTDADIRNWLPGQYRLNSSFKLPVNLPAGTYKLAVAVLDPATGKPGIHLGIEGERGDGWTTLDSLQIKK